MTRPLQESRAEQHGRQPLQQQAADRSGGDKLQPGQARGAAPGLCREPASGASALTRLRLNGRLVSPGMRQVLRRNAAVRTNLPRGTRKDVPIPAATGAYTLLKRGCEQSWAEGRGQLTGNSLLPTPSSALVLPCLWPLRLSTSGKVDNLVIG